MNTMQKTTKTVLFASLMASLLFTSAGIHAATADNNDIESDEQLLKKKIDEIVGKITLLHIENDKLEKLKHIPNIKKIIDYNEKTINELFAQLDIISPPIPTVEIPEETKTLMNSAIAALIQSGLPVYALGINTETGNLDINVESQTNVDADIRAITGNLPISIKYDVNTFEFQGSGGVAAPDTATNFENPNCRDIHVYVESPSGKFACIKESTAEKFGWHIIATSKFTTDEMPLHDSEH